MKIFFIAILFTLIVYQSSFCRNRDDDQSNIKNHYQLAYDFKIQDEQGFFDVEFTPRRTRALIFSSFIPGAGQTYLGNELKGMAISVAFYGTALTAVIAHNNAQGREDRIKVLTQEYSTKGNYKDAEKVWQAILTEKSNRDNDYDRRSLFTWTAVAVWVYNVFDLIFLTEDQGENQFSLSNPVIDMELVTNHDFNGVALKLILP